MPSVTAYRARWILPVDARPVEHAFLTVAAGRIVSLTSQCSGPYTDLGEVALIPGLVNCHTHLEFSALPAPLQPFLPFTEWIRSVMAYRREQPHSTGDAIQRGLAESVAGGATLLGDIATAGWTWRDYTLQSATASQRPDLVVFQELLGLTPERCLDQRELAASHMVETSLPPACSVGLSPHAPYSTHPELFASALELTEAAAAPVAVHLAETTSELELLREGTGEFHDLLDSLGLPQEGLFGERTCREWLDRLVDQPRGLVIHGNYLDAHDLAVLARAPHCTLVYCPRTHAGFGHPPHPWLDLLNMGGSVGLGTDSRASNPDLSMWSELQYLSDRFPNVSPLTILQLGTLAGARALGRGRQAGSLTPGKRANLAVIGLDDPGYRDPYNDLFAPGNRVGGTMIGGEWALSPQAV